MTARLVISEHDQLGGLADDDHVQYLLLAGRAGGQVAKGGTAITDSLELYANSAGNPVDFATDGSIEFFSRLAFNNFNDLTGAVDANFQLLAFSETVDCAGLGLIIPQGFWFTPKFEYNTLQSFGGASVFQDGSAWEETAFIAGAHGIFDLGSFLAGIRYKVGHALAGTPPATIYGMSAGPGADAGAGSLTVPAVYGFQTNAVFALKAFLGSQEFRNGTICTEYVHYLANSNVTNGLVLEGGSTIVTEIGLKLNNIAHGAAAISILSDAIGAYMQHKGDIRIDSDTTGLKLGAGLDASLIYGGADLTLDASLIAASDFRVACGTDKTLELVETVWDDLRVAMTRAIPGPALAPTFAQFVDDGGGSTGVYAYMFPDNAERQLFFSMQMPHSYKEGTDLLAHVHWSPQTVSLLQVDWLLEYTIANIDGTFGNTVTIKMSDLGDGTVNKHQVTASVSINGAGLTVSHMLICRIYRDGGVGTDAFVGDAALLEFDVHFEVNTMGSRQELVK